MKSELGRQNTRGINTMGGLLDFDEEDESLQEQRLVSKSK